ncbi:hypothetical protein SDC9_184631 [bioreactor metagenome]|uniref:Uncharacterized protein n=1 Tax=bioreactor metagenome TaxID=1076179 RepID=A0A645HDK2_9ZZZZ
MVIDAKFHTAHNFSGFHPFVADAEILLIKITICIRTHDAHGNIADADIGFVPHLTNCCRTACKTENFFLDIFRNRAVCNILNITTVDRKCRKSLLGVRCKYRRKINRTRSLRAVESPDGFDGRRVHIHCLTAVAPAGCDGECCANILCFKIFRTNCRFCAAADGAG